MTEERLALTELLEKAGDGDFLRSVAEAVLQLLMEADVDGLIGAGRYERSGERTTWRNGFRARALDTRLGQAEASIPKAQRRAHDLAQRLPRPRAGHAARQAAAEHPEAAAGRLLPAVPRAPEDVREGAGGGDPGGLDRRRVDQARR